jgi:hypothetical protein
MIRVVLPTHLWRLANINREIEVELAGPATIGAVLDALEARYPMLRGVEPLRIVGAMAGG